MSNFSANTRLRGDTKYYKATWLDKGAHYEVIFETGPFEGECFSGTDCEIADIASC